MEDEIACGMCIVAHLNAGRKFAGRKRHVFCHACEEEGGRIASCAHGEGKCGQQIDKKCVEDGKWQDGKKSG